MPACFIRARYAVRMNVLAFLPISTPQSRGCSVFVGPVATLACAAPVQRTALSTAASAQSARNPPERLGRSLAVPDEAESGAAAL
jgi:hypothetical protein